MRAKCGFMRVKRVIMRVKSANMRQKLIGIHLIVVFGFRYLLLRGLEFTGAG